MFCKPGLRTFGALAVAAAIIGASAVAFAGEADVKFRQSTMKAVGGHMNAMAAIIKGEVKHASHLRAHAGAMASLGKMGPDIFAKGTEGGSTKADAWKKPEEFKKALAAFAAASGNLYKATQGTDKKAVGGAFAALGKTCKDCHDSFREKQK